MVVTAETVETASAPITILVVEDEIFIRLDVADGLRREGFFVIEAANADEAVKILMTQPQIVVVFTDVRMPGTMDGLGLADYVRANHRGSE